MVLVDRKREEMLPMLFRLDVFGSWWRCGMFERRGEKRETTFLRRLDDDDTALDRRQVDML